MAILILTEGENFKGSKAFDADVDNIITQLPEDPNYGVYVKLNGEWVEPTGDLCDEIWIRPLLDSIQRKPEESANV